VNRPTKIGLVGTVITALCCFTPLLVWSLAAIGLAGIGVYLDIVLLPLLGIFILILLWGLFRTVKAR
jgi:mercuric ion transport protein